MTSAEPSPGESWTTARVQPYFARHLIASL
jgi:hypothetical protein